MCYISAGYSEKNMYIYIESEESEDQVISEQNWCILECAFPRYLEGQNCTSSTVFSCPRKVPRACMEGLEDGESSLPSPLEDLMPPVLEDFVDPGSVAKVEMWSWILHSITDLSFPGTNINIIRSIWMHDTGQWLLHSTWIFSLYILC